MRLRGRTTLVPAGVHHWSPKPSLFAQPALEDSVRGPVSFGMAGLDGVCGLLADGYPFPLDIRG